MTTRYRSGEPRLPAVNGGLSGGVLTVMVLAVVAAAGIAGLALHLL